MVGDRNLEERQVLPFALGQLVGGDRAERRGLAGEPNRGVGQRIRTFEAETTRRERAEQQGATQIGPVLEVRFDAGSPGEAATFIRVFCDIPPQAGRLRYRW